MLESPINIKCDGVRVGAIHRAIDLLDATSTPEKAVKLVADIASLSYGNDAAKNPEKLFRSIVERGHLSCLEFIPSFRVTKKIALPLASFRASHSSWGDDPIKGLTYFLEWRLHSNQDLTKSTALLIECPILVARQWMRHRSASYLEMSRRYVKASKVPFEFYDRGELWECEHYESSVALYDRLIADGERPERARRVIPQGATTKFWVGAFDLGYGWESFTTLRDDAHAQPEIAVFASEIRRILNGAKAEGTHNPA